jgi:hypothetical protein
MTGYGLDDHASIPGRGTDYSSFPFNNIFLLNIITFFAESH